MQLTLTRPLRLLLLGAPGSGKGTQTAKLLEQISLPTLSSGDLLRHRTAQDSELQAVIARGDLVDDAVMSSLSVDELQRRGLTGDDSWLLDGFPRTLNQAKVLQGALDYNINCVVELHVSHDVILHRIEQRWVHVPSGRIYNLEYNPPNVPGKDDITGEPLSKRPDDNVTVFQHRLDEHHRTITPLREFYKEMGVFHRVSGETSDIIFPKLLDLLKDKFIQ